MFGIIRRWRQWRRLWTILRSGQIKMGQRQNTPPLFGYGSFANGYVPPLGQILVDPNTFDVQVGDGVARLSDLPIHQGLTDFIKADLHGSIADTDSARDALLDEYTSCDLSTLSRRVRLLTGINPPTWVTPEECRAIEQ